MHIGDAVVSKLMPRWRGRVVDVWDHDLLGRVALVHWERRGNQYMPMQLKKTVATIDTLTLNKKTR